MKPLVGRSLVSTTLAGAAGAALVGLPSVPRGFVAPAIGVLAAAGALLGAAFGAALLSLARVSPRARTAVWIASGCASGAWLAARLGAFGRLDGPFAKLAAAVIAVALLGGAAVGSLAAAVQPDASGTPWASRFSAPWRLTAGVVLLVSAWGAVMLDSWSPLLRGYPTARQALVAYGWFASTAALLLAACRVPWTDPRTLVAGAAASVLVPLLGLVAAARSDSLGRLASDGSTEHALGQLRFLTDWDRDGASSMFGGGDCAPFDSSIHPRAREVPGNGVDDNCQYGDAPRFPSTKSPSPPAPGAVEPPALDLVLITVDALRADHTSVYGYARDTTPSLRQLAASARVFENAYASGGWTGLALPSMLAGVYPRGLEWAYFPIGAAAPAPSAAGAAHADPRYYVLPLPADERRWTLPAALAARGYRTIAALSRGLGPFEDGLRPGFAVTEVALAEDDAAVTQVALRRAGEAGGVPMFLWVHYYSPHEPMRDHPDLPRFGDTTADRYDQEILAADREVGRLLSGLDAISRRPRAVLFTADHGEILSDRYQWHGLDLCEPSIRVPLLLVAPGVAPARVGTPASAVDVAPTLLALAGAARPAEAVGEDLRALAGNRTVLSDLWRYERDGTVFLDQVVASDEGRHLTLDRLKNRRFLTRARDAGCPAEELHEAPPERLEHALEVYTERIAGGP